MTASPFATAATVLPPAPAAADPFGAPQGQPQQQPASLAGDPFGNPAPKASYPRVRELSPIGTQGAGCLVLITPHSILPGRAPDGKPNETMTCDVVVLDPGAAPGGFIMWGGKPEKGTPHTLKIDTFPAEFKQAKISNVGIVNACRTALENRQNGVNPGVVLGRVTMGPLSDPTKNPPFLLDLPNEDDKNKARAYYANR